MAGCRPTEFDARLGLRLRELRRAAGMPQRELAAAIGVSYAQLQKYEKGSNGMKVSLLRLACRKLAISPVALFDPEDDPDGGSGSQDRSPAVAPSTPARAQQQA